MSSGLRFVPIVFFSVFLIPLPACAETTAKLAPNTVAVLYENITDGPGMGRSVKDTVDMLRDTRAGFIFRGFWQWEPVVESPDQIPAALFSLTSDQRVSPDQVAARLRTTGNYYRSLKKWISSIKREIPELVFCGALPAQHLSRVDYNPVTGRVFMPEETWAMALDPQKWSIVHKGKPMTKADLQERQYGKKGRKYDRHRADAYAPDITNPDFQDLLIGWAQKQIDSGADAIWIDMLQAQGNLMLRMTEDPDHPAVKEAFAAAAKIVDEIHRYGSSNGRPVLAGSWGQSETANAALFATAKLDFVTVTPSNEETANKTLDETRWEETINAIRQIHGNVPVFAFIDWTGNASPLATFSQKLRPDNQKKAIEAFDAAFARMGVTFVYPLHGGDMGKKASRLSFGKLRVYDSLAPEFATFATIKGLAQRKNGNR